MDETTLCFRVPLHTHTQGQRHQNMPQLIVNDSRMLQIIALLPKTRKKLLELIYQFSTSNTMSCISEKLSISNLVLEELLMAITVLPVGVTMVILHFSCVLPYLGIGVLRQWWKHESCNAFMASRCHCRQGYHHLHKKKGRDINMVMMSNGQMLLGTTDTWNEQDRMISEHRGEVMPTFLTDSVLLTWAVYEIKDRHNNVRISSNIYGLRHFVLTNSHEVFTFGAPISLKWTAKQFIKAEQEWHLMSENSIRKHEVLAHVLNRTKLNLHYGLIQPLMFDSLEIESIMVRPEHLEMTLFKDPTIRMVFDLREFITKPRHYNKRNKSEPPDHLCLKIE